MEPQQRQQWTDQLCEQLLSKFDAKVVKTFNSFANIVYLVKDNSSEFVLRISHSQLRAKALVEEEISWLNHLHQTIPNFTAQKPIKHNGEYIHTITSTEDKNVEFYAVCFQLQHGKNFLDIETDQRPKVYQSLGKIIGQMHNATKTYETKSETKRFTYLDEFCYRAFEREKKTLTEEYPFIKEKYEFYLEKVKKFIQENMDNDYGLIHSDVQPSNYLIDDDFNIRLFDFDACCYCHYALDISNIFFYGIQRHENITKEEGEMIMKNFMKGYREEYQLKNEEAVMEILDAFSWLRLTIMFIYFIPHKTEPFVTFKNAIESDLKNCEHLVDTSIFREFRKLIVAMHKGSQ